MTLHDICISDGEVDFTIGKGKTVWSSASYVGRMVKVECLCKETDKGAKPWLMGLFYKKAYFEHTCKINLVKND